MKGVLFSSISLIIPIYNNEDTLFKNINASIKIIQSFTNAYEVIICNDASTDKTASILKRKFQNKKNFTIITHKKNQGIAKTIKALYKHAKHDYIVLFSVDGDWNTQDIRKMLIKMHHTKAGILIGKRNNPNYTVYRKTVTFFYNFLPLILFFVNTIDAGSIKVIRKVVLNNISIQSKSTFFEAEIIIKAKKNGFKVTSIPVYYKKKNNQKGTGGDFKYVLDSIVDLFILRFTFWKI